MERRDEAIASREADMKDKIRHNGDNNDGID